MQLPWAVKPYGSCNETLGNGGAGVSFRALMKRIAYCLFVAALALGFNACEGHKVDNLPEKYKENGGHHAAGAEGHESPAKSGEGEKAPAGEHAKPAEGEKKAH